MNERKKKSVPTTTSPVHSTVQHLETLEARQLLSASVVAKPNLTVLASAVSGTVKGYTPAQIKAAYGITGDGSNQTIAVVDAYSDPNIAADLKVFDKQFGLTDPSLTQMSATGSTTNLPAANASWAQEISLDVEWAHAIAPKANIILVDAASDSISSLMKAVKYATTISSVSVVSMSWGSSEFSTETQYDSIFTTPTGHQGITFVAASGDEGAAGGAEYPASSPNVLSVGGTTLSISSTGTISSESAWRDSSGGTSRYESAPTFQTSAGVSTSGRKSPDVSYDANPSTGFAVYDSLSYQGSSGWMEMGGTSAGAPQWAAIVAIADSARVSAGGTTLTTNATLSSLYSLYSNSSTYSTNFNDITSGSSNAGGGFGGFGFGGGFGRGFGGFRGGQSSSVSATTGYDTLTGIGTPKAGALISALSAAKTSTATASTTKASTSTKVLRAKAALVANVVDPTSYVNLSRTVPAFVAGRVGEALDVETTAGDHAMITIDSAAASSSHGTLVALSGLLIENDAREAAMSTAVSYVATESAHVASLVRTAVADAIPAITPSLAMPNVVADSETLLSTASLSDAADSLARDLQSASITPEPTNSSGGIVKPLIFGVAAADAVLLGYYLTKKSKNKPKFSEDGIRE